MIVEGNLVLKEDLNINEDLIVRGNIFCEGGRWNINARNINARNIDARDINAQDIDARDIDARNIDARDISYFAVCFAYNSIICNNINGRRSNAKHFVLDGKIIIEQGEKEK